MIRMSQAEAARHGLYSRGATPNSGSASKRSSNEWSFALMCQSHGLPVPVLEHRFHPTRKWRFDYAWPSVKLAVEKEGGAYVAGRHTRGKGFEDDLEKYNTAALMGWRLLRFLPKQFNDGSAIEIIRHALKVEPFVLG